MLTLLILLTAILYDVYALTLVLRVKQNPCSSSVPIISLLGYMIAMLLTENVFLVSPIIDLITLTIFHISIHFVIPILIHRAR